MFPKPISGTSGGNFPFRMFHLFAAAFGLADGTV
jgi:hypothetical protein